MGDLLAGGGEVGAALEHHSRALHAFEGLAGADPDNPRYQRDVAVILGRVGDLLAGRGEVGAALEHHTRSLHIASGWPARTPTTRSISAAWRPPSSRWGICWPAGVRWARRWSTTADPCTLSSGWPGRTPTTPNISATWRPPSSGWGICWPGGVRWARRWSTSPEPCTLSSGWPGRTPTTPQYQRDVAVTAFRVAGVLESVGDASAIDYWSKTHQVLAALDKARKLPDGDRQFLDHVARKLDAS